MFLRIHNDRGVERLYICQSTRNGNKVKSSIIKSLGRVDSLMKELDVSRDEVIKWANDQVSALDKAAVPPVSLSLHPDRLIGKGERRSFNAGYLFLQELYTGLNMRNVCRNIKRRHKYEFDLDAILSDLIYARILEPGSKRSSYSFCQSLMEPPKYHDYDVYRALSILAEESDYIQAEAYKNSNFLLKRNNRVLYYDCTNFFFEIEEDDDLRKYGKSKENRPNPIVQMGLFMDGDGIPLAFNIFPGNQNEQPSMKPLEKDIIRNFGFDKFVVCTDGGLGSDSNRQFNDMGNRAFICTQSLKKLKKDEQEAALDDRNWKRLSDGEPVDITEIRENPQDHMNELFYKEEAYGTKKVSGQLMIVTYSPRYAVYQKHIRAGQIERAEKMIANGTKRKGHSNPNDPARFIIKTSVTADGEAADRTAYALNETKIAEEEMFDGFYAVCTNLVDDDIKDILFISEMRWMIEESFCIMKTDFEARPVYLSREDRIKAHFLICFLSLLIYRILEKKLDEKHTCSEIVRTLREYRLLKLEGAGYIPEYTRTDLTDHLHEVFGFRTDMEIITPSAMRKIISDTKKRTPTLHQ